MFIQHDLDVWSRHRIVTTDLVETRAPLLRRQIEDSIEVCRGPQPLAAVE
jgi:hypothetical protein